MAFQFLKEGYQKFKALLTQTGSLLGSRLRALFTGQPFDEETLDKLEQLFYEADMGVQTAQELTQCVREQWRSHPALTPDELIAHLKEQLVQLIQLSAAPSPSALPQDAPHVILVVGVNGNGKTTSIAKLAYRWQQEGKKVILAAADTFRAAASDQLAIWSERLHVEIVKGHAKSDPAAVAFDAITAAKSRQADCVLIDTAGRLHNKVSLMQELEKIRRARQKVHPSAPHETLLVLDATIGQNAVDQAKMFHHYTPLTGLILSKMDSRAKGGIVIQIQRQLGLPVQWIGTGEGLEDLQSFHAQEFVDALFEN